MIWPSRAERIARTADHWAVRSADPLSAQDAAERDAWRAADPRHERAWQTAQLLMAETAGMRRPARQMSAPRPRHRTSVKLAMAGVAAAVVAGGGALFLGQHASPVDQAGGTEAIATAEARILRLADGTMVRLDRDSAIRSDMTGTVRSVLLEHGTARFDVAHDAAHPFVVTAADRRVTAIGTRFEVRLGEHGVVVTLFQGVVEVAKTTRQSGAVPVRMRQGQRFSVDDGQEQLQSVQADADRADAKPSDIDATPIALIIDRANRSGATPIRLADPLLGDRRIQGRFDVGDTDALARQLGAALDLDVTRRSSGWLLSSRQTAGRQLEADSQNILEG